MRAWLPTHTQPHDLRRTRGSHQAVWVETRASRNRGWAVVVGGYCATRHGLHWVSGELSLQRAVQRLLWS
jgi:hypothetical protein